MQSILEVAVWWLSIASIVWAMFEFDRLLRWEIEHYPQCWDEDGRPRGYLCKPPGAYVGPWWRPLEAKNRQIALARRWLFKTPNWALNHANCQSWLRRYRLASALGFFSIVFGAVLTFTS
jgi:hypothetical protein